MGGLMLTLYDAARCPYCARVRIVLAEKDIEYETIEIDLSDRPAWIYEKNSTGRVPVVEEDAWVLPESAVQAASLAASSWASVIESVNVSRGRRSDLRCALIQVFTMMRNIHARRFEPGWKESNPAHARM